jgi:Ca-activated chloride channel family protein
MTFGAPEWFDAFLLVPLLAGLFVRNEMLRNYLLGKLVAARLLPQLAASTSTPRRRWKYGLALAGLACVIAAMTEPRFGYQVVQTHRRGLDLMIAIDTSRSMLSTDVQPDRLSRAKFAAQDLIDSLDGVRVGLIAFAGTAFVEAPLTIDYSAVENSVNALDTNTIPRGGTNIASAIREAAEAFGKGESTHRALVLFTDGEELEDDAVQAAKDVSGQFRIFTVGMGTAAGSLIPIQSADGGTDFLKDDQGQYVKSHLDELKLRQIANATGGFYVHMENGPATAKAIIEQGLQKMQEHEFETRETIPIESYQWPLALGILLLVASRLVRERRTPVRKPVRRTTPAVRPAELATAAALALLLLVPERSWAVNEGLNLYDKQDYQGAYNVFENQLQHNPGSDGLEFDQGASAYKEGDYDKALDAFGKVLGGKDQGLRGQAEYNIGNTLVQRGALQQGKDEKVKEWTEALKHYEQALKVDPKNEDAKYNEDVVRKMIDDLNKKQQQQNQQQQNQQQQNQQQQNQQQQNQQQQNQQQQNQQQQNQQQQNQQQQNQQQQNQQAQNQQQQNQQQQNQQAQNQQQQKQQGQGQQQQNQQAQNQQQQNQGQGQQQQNQQQPGSQGQQNQQAQQGQDQQNQGSPNQNQTANATPSPTPGNGQGALQERSQQNQQAEAQAAARAATEKQAQPGEMTPSQAQALIDSLRGDEEHVSFENKHDNDQPVYKDW